MHTHKCTHACTPTTQIKVEIYIYICIYIYMYIYIYIYVYIYIYIYAYATPHPPPPPQESTVCGSCRVSSSRCRKLRCEANEAFAKHASNESNECTMCYLRFCFVLLRADSGKQLVVVCILVSISISHNIKINVNGIVAFALVSMGRGHLIYDAGCWIAEPYPPPPRHAQIQICRIPVTVRTSPTWRLQSHQLSRGSRPKHARSL